MVERGSDRPRLMLSMLIAAGLVNFLDRSSLSVALLPIRAELHLSATQIGVLISTFSLSYGFAQLPAGPLLDRVNSWRVVGSGLGLWSLAQLLTGTVASLRGFVPLRLLLGAGEAPFFTGAIKLIRERFPLAYRARAIGGVNISSTLGQALAPPLLTALMVRFGWRSMFMLIGGVGILLALLWFAVERRAVPAPASAPPTQQLSWAQWAALFRNRRVWGMMLGFGGINYTGWFYIAWLPTYLQTARGVSVLHSGWLAALPFLAGSAGMYVSGSIADRRVRSGASPLEVHMSQIVAGMLLSACFTLSAAQVGTVGYAVACISAALFCIHFAGTSGWAYAQAAAPRNMVATVGSVQNFGSFVIASAGPLATGRLLDLTHTFKTAFTLCAAVSLAGAACYVLLAHQRQSPKLEIGARPA